MLKRFFNENRGRKVRASFVQVEALAPRSSLIFSFNFSETINALFSPPVSSHLSKHQRTIMKTFQERVQALPAELYNEIYDLTFTNTSKVQRIDQNTKPPSALQINRALREKFAQSYYGNNTIFYISITHVSKWLFSLQPTHVHKLTTLRIQNRELTYKDRSWEHAEPNLKGAIAVNILQLTQNRVFPVSLSTKAIEFVVKLEIDPLRTHARSVGLNWDVAGWYEVEDRFGGTAHVWEPEAGWRRLERRWMSGDRGVLSLAWGGR